MKTVYLSFVACCLFSITSAQKTTTSTSESTTKTIQVEAVAIPPKADMTPPPTVPPPAAEQNTGTKSTLPPPPNQSTETVLTKWQKIFVLLPVILFVLMLLIVKLCSRISGINLVKVIYREDPEQLINTVEDGAGKTTTTKTVVDKNDEPVHFPSSSRLIALLTGFTTLIICVCLTSFYAYCMVRKLPVPDFKNLFEVVIGLGLGVVPYGFNKLGDATKPEK